MSSENTSESSKSGMDMSAVIAAMKAKGTKTRATTIYLIILSIVVFAACWKLSRRISVSEARLDTVEEKLTFDPSVYNDILVQTTQVLTALNDKSVELDDKISRIDHILDVYERERLKDLPLNPKTPTVKVTQYLVEDKPTITGSYEAMQNGELDEYLEEKGVGTVR